MPPPIKNNFRPKLTLLFLFYLGDGAGILVAIPHLFFSDVVEKECGFKLPPKVLIILLNIYKTDLSSFLLFFLTIFFANIINLAG